MGYTALEFHVVGVCVLQGGLCIALRPDPQGVIDSGFPTALDGEGDYGSSPREPLSKRAFQKRRRTDSLSGPT